MKHVNPKDLEDTSIEEPTGVKETPEQKQDRETKEAWNKQKIDFEEKLMTNAISVLGHGFSAAAGWRNPKHGMIGFLKATFNHVVLMANYADFRIEDYAKNLKKDDDTSVVLSGLSEPEKTESIFSKANDAISRSIRKSPTIAPNISGAMGG